MNSIKNDVYLSCSRTDFEQKTWWRWLCSKCSEIYIAGGNAFCKDCERAFKNSHWAREILLDPVSGSLREEQLASNQTIRDLCRKLPELGELIRLDITQKNPREDQDIWWADIISKAFRGPHSSIRTDPAGHSDLQLNANNKIRQLMGIGYETRSPRLELGDASDSHQALCLCTANFAADPGELRIWQDAYKRFQTLFIAAALQEPHIVATQNLRFPRPSFECHNLVSQVADTATQIVARTRFAERTLRVANFSSDSSAFAGSTLRLGGAYGQL